MDRHFFLFVCIMFSDSRLQYQAMCLCKANPNIQYQFARSPYRKRKLLELDHGHVFNGFFLDSLLFKSHRSNVGLAGFHFPLILSKIVPICFQHGHARGVVYCSGHMSKLSWQRPVPY